MQTLALTALSFPEISPALIEIGPFPLRWYAISYIVGLMLAWRYAVYLINRPALFGGTSPATKEDIDDIIFYVMMGVILGGRIGYILFYQVPFEADRIAQDPMMLLRVWEGGMSFHGGLIGVCLAIFLTARARKLPLFQLADIGGVVTPIAIVLVRLANFINAELYGRPTDGPFGMVFPRGCPTDEVGRCIPSTPPSYDWANNAWTYSGNEVPRHPSQLYEAALEGLLPMIVLGVLVFRFKILQRPGLAAGLFMLMYGIGRSIAEQFREPDAHIEFLAGDWLTMGMLLSLPVWIGGAWFVWQGLKAQPVKDEAPAKA